MYNNPRDSHKRIGRYHIKQLEDLFMLLIQATQNLFQNFLQKSPHHHPHNHHHHYEDQEIYLPSDISIWSSFSLLHYICFLPKKLVSDCSYQIWKQKQLLSVTNKYTQNPLWAFYHHENVYWFCPIILYFSFQKFSIVHQFAIKFFLHSITDFVSEFNIFFQLLFVFDEKHALGIIKTFYISTPFWKQDTQL